MLTMLTTRTGLAGLFAAALLAAAPPAAAIEVLTSVYASGLNAPRGLGFDPGGALWITEAGRDDGSTSPSLVTPLGTLVYNETGSLTRVAGGVQTRPLSGLPSLFILGRGQVDAGIADISFDPAGAMSLLFSGMPSAVFPASGYRFGTLVMPGGTVVDITAHEMANNPAGGPIDSNPFKMERAGADWLVADAAANALLRVKGDGGIETVAVFPARDLGGPRPPTDSVPTGVALGPDGAAYVSELTGFPFFPGAARIHRVAPDGTQSVLASGFTMLIDLAFDADGDLYALEYDSNGLLAPGSTGQLWKVNDDGSKSLVWRDTLVNPTGLAIGPDGAFYVANRGNSGAGQGEVLRIALVDSPATLALVAAALGALVLRRREAAPARCVP